MTAARRKGGVYAALFAASSEVHATRFDKPRMGQRRLSAGRARGRNPAQNRQICLGVSREMEPAMTRAKSAFGAHQPG